MLTRKPGELDSPFKPPVNLYAVCNIVLPLYNVEETETYVEDNPFTVR